MRRLISGGLRMVAGGAVVLATGGWAAGYGATAAPASSAGSTGHVRIAGQPASSTLSEEIQRAQARFAVNVRKPHPGRPAALTHPASDHAGTGIAAHAGVMRASPGAAGARAAPGSAGTPGQQGPAAGSSFSAAASSVPGMDVSAYQGNVNWSQAAAGGAQFAYIKATEGTYYTNPYFAQQYSGSYSAGLDRGAYQFAIPSNSTGAAQADYFVAHGGGWSADGRTLPGALDIEYNPYSGGECYGLSRAQMVNWISSFDGEYAALTGRRPAIYTTTDWWTTCTGNAPGFSAESLWVANYGGTPYPLPASWKTYTVWQYANHGTYPGDEDVFNGNHAGLVAFAYGAPGPVSPSPTPGTSPGAAQDSSGDQLVAVTDSNGSVQVISRGPTGSFTSATDIGGAAKGGPAVASPGPGQWDVLVRGTDNAAWIKTYRNGAWSGWFSLGGQLSAKPGAAANGQTVTALARGMDGQLYVRPVSRGSWTRLGGQLAPGTGPSGAYGYPGQLTAVVQGTDGSVWIYNGAWWSLGSPSGGRITQEPGASSIRSGELEVFARSYAGNAAWHRWWNSASGWSPWYSLGGRLASGTPAAAYQGTTRSDVQDIYALGTDSNVWAVTDTKGSWGTWSRVP